MIIATSMFLLRNASADCRSKQRKHVASAGMSTCSAGMGSEHGIATWDTARVFVLVISAKAAGKSGDGASHKTFILYAGVSGCSGCWMTGADDVGWSFGRSENLLVARQMRIGETNS